MKTRQELILDFMLALAAGIYGSEQTMWKDPEDIYDDACQLVDKYLEKM